VAEGAGELAARERISEVATTAMRRFLFVAAALLATARLAAADISGQWALNIVDKDATHRHASCTFVQAGARLSGFCGPEKGEGVSLTGEIHDAEVSWEVEGGPSYRATLDQTQRFLRGTFSGDGEGLFTAMKTK
jgi:hypothetical protein